VRGSGREVPRSWGMAAVRPFDPRPALPAGHHHEFHVLRLGTHTFRGVVAADGPRLECGCNDVSLLHAGIARFSPDDVTSPGFPEGWYVALDGTHPRIALLDLDDGSRERLASVFGIPVAPWIVRRRAFYDSPAFEHLASWVARNPSLVDALLDTETPAAAPQPDWLRRARERHDCDRAVTQAAG
jgi:hypothetical protein